MCHVSSCARPWNRAEPASAAPPPWWPPPRTGWGARRGDWVACFLRNVPEHRLTWVVAGKLEAIWVPLDARRIGEDLVHTLTNAMPSVLVVEQELAVG